MLTVVGLVTVLANTHSRLARLELFVVGLNLFVLDLLLVLLVLVVEEGGVILLLLHVGLWGLVLLVKLHFLHLLLKIRSLLVLDCLFLHRNLVAAELFEHVLVVKDSMCKFVLE